MTEGQTSLPKWILIVSGLFSLLELMVSLLLCFSPQSVLETVDLNAKGVDYLIYMWLRGNLPSVLSLVLRHLKNQFLC